MSFVVPALLLEVQSIILDCSLELAHNGVLCEEMKSLPGLASNGSQYQSNTKDMKMGH